MRLRNLFIVAVLPLLMAGRCDPGAGLTCPTPKTYSNAFLDAFNQELVMIDDKAPHVVQMLKDYDVSLRAIRACIKRKKKMRTPRRDMYGRRVNSQVWHFHQECPNYPPNDASEFKRDRPTKGRLCKKCFKIEEKSQQSYKNGWQPD